MSYAFSDCSIDWARSRFIRIRVELGKGGQRPLDHLVFIPLLGRKVKEDHRNIGIGTVGGNLRAHHLCAQYRDFTNLDVKKG